MAKEYRSRQIYVSWVDKIAWFEKVRYSYVYTLYINHLANPMPDKQKKKSKKDSQLIIRISKKDRDDFVELCDDLDTSAAREIRGFIRTFLSKHKRK